MVARKFRRILLTLAGLLPCASVWAQWQDSFENGLAAWHGTTEYFVADSGLLLSRGPEKKSALWLGRAFGNGEDCDSAFRRGLLRGDSVLCFEFGISLQFVPSSTNSLRLYLLSTDSLNADSCTALYLQLGQKGGENRWQFFYQSPDTGYMLWQGQTVYSKQKQMDFRLRARYLPMDSCWKFYAADTLENAVWEQDGDSLRTGRLMKTFLPDTASADSALFYSGIMALYQTASRAGQYGFTYALAGRLPPEIPKEPQPDIVHRPVDPEVSLVADTFRLWFPPSAGSLAINEILFEPRSGQSRFVEIVNLRDTIYGTVNLALGVPGDKGWKYSRLCKDKFLWLKPGAYQAFAKDAAAIAPDCRQELANILTAASFPTLNEKEGRLRLAWLPPEKESGDTVVIDEVFYSRDFHHWLLSDTKGVSLERLDARKPACSQENWASAAETAGYATPGCENSHHRGAPMENEPAYFRLEPPLVTPNNDGLNDFLYIRWNAKLSGCVCSMTVYDDYGRKMKTLCQQLLLGAEGEIRYDATDHAGRVLRPGIYVLYIDLVRPDKRHKRLKYALAVG